MLLFASFSFVTASMILGAAPVFAEEEVKVEETKEINYKEAYLQNVVAAKEAAVKEAEAKLEAAKKAVENNYDVKAAKAGVVAAEKVLENAKKELAKSDKTTEEEIQKLLDKMDGKVEKDDAYYGKLVQYAQKQQEINASKKSALVLDQVDAKAKAAQAAFNAYKADKTEKNYDAAKEAIDAYNKAAANPAQNVAGNLIAKSTITDITLDGSDKTKPSNLDTVGPEVITTVTNTGYNVKLQATYIGTLEEDAKQLKKTISEDKFVSEKEIDGYAAKIYELTHNFDHSNEFFKVRYAVEVAEKDVVAAKAKLEVVLKAAPQNADVVKAEAALEAAKAELEAAKAELNAAKAGVEEKPEVVVDNR